MVQLKMAFRPVFAAEDSGAKQIFTHLSKRQPMRLSDEQRHVIREESAAIFDDDTVV